MTLKNKNTYNLQRRAIFSILFELMMLKNSGF